MLAVGERLLRIKMKEKCANSLYILNNDVGVQIFV